MNDSIAAPSRIRSRRKVYAPEYAPELRAYERLAAAILLAAVQDWRKARGCGSVVIGGEHDPLIVTLDSIKPFWSSAWFLILCDAARLDSRKVLKHLRVCGVPYWKMRARRKKPAD